MTCKLTGLLASVMMTTVAAASVGAPVTVSAAETIDSEKADPIFESLLEDIGLNSAAACGVLGNIFQECRLDPTAGSSYYGLCQWGGSRRQALEAFASERGMSIDTVETQMAFLQSELTGSYSQVLEELEQVPDTEEGARKAAEIFCRQFEQPGNLSTEITRRAGFAADLFWPLYGGQTLSSLKGPDVLQAPLSSQSSAALADSALTAPDSGLALPHFSLSGSDPSQVPHRNGVSSDNQSASQNTL